MNPYGIQPTPRHTFEIAAWNRAIQRSIDEYWQHPFAACPHDGNCTKRLLRRARAVAL